MVNIGDILICNWKINSGTKGAEINEGEEVAVIQVNPKPEFNVKVISLHSGNESVGDAGYGNSHAHFRITGRKASKAVEILYKKG